MEQTLEQRCKVALECLPDAPYRTMLARLFDELLASPCRPRQTDTGVEQTEPFWCHEQSHDRARCESQCAECAEVAPSQAPIGLAQQLAAAAEAIEAGHDPLCMSVLRGKACTCGVALPREPKEPT